MKWMLLLVLVVIGVETLMGTTAPPVLWADMTLFLPVRGQEAVQATYESEIKLGKLVDSFGTTAAEEHL